jgi:hypothetical protein
MMPLRDIHALLQHAFEQIASLRGECDDVSTDTAFAIGEALGTISKAKGLVGRDIDDAAARATP